MRANFIPSDLKTRIQRHYDIAAPLYQDLWGVHIHHGYWQLGTESKERAQEQLVEFIADKAGIRHGSRVLDIGCGFGGSAMYLATHFHAQVLGITLSRVQARMAAQLSSAAGVEGCAFAVMDAEEMALHAEFDAVWSIEALSHMRDRHRVIEDASRFLTRGGVIAIADWFKQPGMAQRDEAKYIQPLESGMLVPELDTIDNYAGRIQALGFRVTSTEDVSQAVSKTWDVGRHLTHIPAVWRFAKNHGSDFIRFLRAFQLMQTAYRLGVFRYGIITAEKL
jgi:tocopherol O-methyltransferase